MERKWSLSQVRDSWMNKYFLFIPSQDKILNTLREADGGRSFRTVNVVKFTRRVFNGRNFIRRLPREFRQDNIR